MRRGQLLNGDSETELMLSAIAHDLSLPLLQIKAKAELGKFNNKTSEEFKLLTQSGLKLIDSYLIALEFRQSANQLVLEPVSIGSVLADSAHELSKLAEYYKTKIEINITGRARPILTNKASLQSAFYCLGASLIKSQADSESKNNVLVLSAYKNKQDSITAGIYANILGLTDKELYNSRKLAGKAKQPFSALSSSSGGGILIADMLLTTLYQPLRASKFKHLSGFSTQFPISKQLRLV